PPRDTPHSATPSCYQDGKKLAATDLLAALEYCNGLSRAFGAFFEQYPLFLSPTLARRPVPHGEMNQNQPGITAWEGTQNALELVPFTPASNPTAQPAISLPLHWSPDGLPVGVQIAGRFGDEAGLLRLAAPLRRS